MLDIYAMDKGFFYVTIITTGMSKFDRNACMPSKCLIDNLWLQGKREQQSVIVSLLQNMA